MFIIFPLYVIGTIAYNVLRIKEVRRRRIWAKRSETFYPLLAEVAAPDLRNSFVHQRKSLQTENVFRTSWMLLDLWQTAQSYFGNSHCHYIRDEILVTNQQKIVISGWYRLPIGHT
jgi:hypothetical protein